MTNPNNAIGTNGAYDGRTSVNAFNDNLALYNGAGVLSGWNVRPDSGLVLYVGGQTVRDVAVAQDPAGNRTTVNNISGSAVSVTLPGAPATGKRIDLIVAYVENPPQGSSSEVDNPTPCGLITVSSTASSNPSTPNDTAIRNAITADGAAGSTAYYAILGSILIPSGTTTVTSNMITQGAKAAITSANVDFTTFTLSETKAMTVTGTTNETGNIVSSSALLTNASSRVVLGFSPISGIDGCTVLAYKVTGVDSFFWNIKNVNGQNVTGRACSFKVFYADIN